MWIIVVIYIAIIIWMTFAYINQWGNNPVDVYGYVFFMVLFVGILSGAYGTTVIVTDKQMLIKFGIGYYTKKINLSEVKSVDMKDSPFYYGNGIRIITDGMLFKAGGRQAVEIRFKNKKGIIQIGTKDCASLRSAIESGINKENQFT
jgi:hypothetical protein